MVVVVWFVVWCVVVLVVVVVCGFDGWYVDGWVVGVCGW